MMFMDHIYIFLFLNLEKIFLNVFFYLFLQAGHIYICDFHKSVIQNLRTKRKRKESEDDSGETDTEHPEVDLFQLQVNTLR